MADAFYTNGKILLQTDIDIDNDTIKVMLVDNSYSFDATDVYVDEGGGTGPVSGEITGATNYVRKTLSNIAVAILSGTTVKTDNTVDADTLWTALGPGGTIYSAIVLRDNGGADTANEVIAFYDTGYGSGVPTNGSNIQHQWHADGMWTV